MNHVRSTLSENTSWCGVRLGHEFYFKDAESAAINGDVQDISHTLQKPCILCVDKIIKCLRIQNENEIKKTTEN